MYNSFLILGLQGEPKMPQHENHDISEMRENFGP